MVVKEVRGAGRQQVRNIWPNLAVHNMNLWMQSLVQMWFWDQRQEDLYDWSDSPQRRTPIHPPQ